MNNTTINKAEIDKFSKIADEWWDPNGKFKPIHKFNPLRIEYIKKSIFNHFNLKHNKSLNKLEFLDIGCGGGLLCEPFSRLGANVTGIDASERNIKIAKAHLKKSKLKIDYFCATPENLEIKKKFDVILNMEVVEHVENVDFFIKKSSEYLKKNGLMFVATLNKTLKSYLFAIVGAEYILNWLPIGTHQWEKFLEPKKLIKYADESSLDLLRLDGVKFDLFRNQWKISDDKSVNYIAKFKKN